MIRLNFVTPAGRRPGPILMDPGLQPAGMTVADTATGLSNSRLGMILLIGSETVLFATFISAYLILRMGAEHWPPYGTPRLEPGPSTFNTALLTLSSVTAFMFRRSAAQGHWLRARRGILASAAAGALFLALQGVEFHRIYVRGLTLQTGVYGAVFYTLISCHGLHVLGGLLIFGWTLSKLRQAGSAAGRVRQAVGNAEIYWHFVTGIWLVLFTILYLV